LIAAKLLRVCIGLDFALNSNLGSIVRILQGNNQIVECNTPPCVLRSHCGLKGILDQALEKFELSASGFKRIPPPFPRMVIIHSCLPMK
jgi:hypothetical protein